MSGARQAAVAGLAGLACLVAPSPAAAAPQAKLQRALDRVVAAGAPGRSCSSGAATGRAG